MSTPMFDQYDRLKAQHRDAILLFRLGDFYEMFGSDAQSGSRILGLTLTHRQDRAMCGVPHHAARGYIRRLLSQGKKVAICEQVGEPDGKTLTRREVVEILSPGSVFDSDFLDADKNNYIVALGLDKGGSFLAVATCDISVGELVLDAHAIDSNGALESTLRRELERLDPVEVLVQESLLESSETVASFAAERTDRVVNRIPDWGFDRAESYRRLIEHLAVRTLHGFGIDADDPALLPAATLFDYLSDNARHALNHLTSVTRHHSDEIVVMDDSTVRNLELVRNMRDGGTAHTLIEIVDKAITPLGSRRIRNWILEPLRKQREIEERLSRVEDLYHRQHDLQVLRELLRDASDLERLAGRLGVEKAHPKDLLAIADTVEVVVRGSALIPHWFGGESFCDTAEEAERLVSIRDHITERIDRDAPISAADGGVIRDGYDDELDRLRSLRMNGRTLLDEYLQEQRDSTGVSSLKIKYNRMLGHFFEVPRGQSNRIPDDFIRRQSLANAERYTTPRLSDIESELNNADSAAIEREQLLFAALRSDLVSEIPLLQKVARRIGIVDALGAFAFAATEYGYRKPVIAPEAKIEIEKGRHPVVEAHLPPGDFVANDLYLGGESPRFSLVTGPNMAGKSTVLRQTALITVMAHIGSYVPAESAIIGVCDRIFCRVGASDNIARGESTFLVEMNETSNILRNATSQSLVIMDEVGRGTSTHDGLSIAWAVCEYLLDTNKARTLFATHYHELATIEHDAFRSLCMAVEHSGDTIYFLKRLVSGGADHSYGVDVARLAGLPNEVILRARDLLAHFERYGTVFDGASTRDGWDEHVAAAPERRIDATPGELFSPDDLIVQQLRSTDPNELSPREALDLLYRWKAQIEDGSKG